MPFWYCWRKRYCSFTRILEAKKNLRSILELFYIINYGGKFYPWLSCYGGVESTCGPVFNFEERLTADESIQSQLNKADFAEMPIGEFDYTSALATLNEEGQNTSMDYALVYYLNEMIHFRMQNHKSFSSYLLDGGANSTSPVVGYKPSMLIGEYSGPLCSICPGGSGRDGNFKSGTICTPCPDQGRKHYEFIWGGIIITLYAGNDDLLSSNQRYKGK